MRHTVLLAAGAALGAALVRAIRGQRAAQRFAAAALESLLNAIDANDAETGLHVRRVASYALIIADAADADRRQRNSIERVALFHDIGKIHEALFDITHEHSRLTPTEWRAIATHPQRGAAVLAPLTPFYPDLAAGVLSHHERWDGTGYPHHLRGTQIPFATRIVSLADTFDAITHGRRYRGPASVAAALRAIEEGRGTQFDPDLVDLMLSPPVLSALLKARRRAASLPSPRKRGRARALHVPDVEFRWQSRSAAPRLPATQA